jgi:TRAP-type mannitol/chloroaromatic compound transport system substrate-binding protein
LTPPPSPAPPAATISPSPSPVISGQPLPPNLTARLTSSLPRSVEGGEDAFIKRLGEISGGRIDVRLFYAGEIVPGLQALDAVSNGTVEMAWSLGEFYYGKDPVFKLLSNIPFGFEPLTHVAWRSQSDVAATIETFLAGYSVFAVPCGLLGRYSDFASRKEIRTVSDLNGMKIRAGNFDGQVLSRLGVVNQQIAAGDIYPSLERRTIDASVWADPHRLEKLALQKVAPNIYYPGSLVPGATIDLFISTGFWKSLGPTGQQYVRQACSDSLVSQNTITLANNQSAVDRMRRDGANIAPLPKDVQRALVKAWDGLAGEISGKNRVFKTLLDSAMLRRNEMLSSSIRQ